ncbi:MAG: hypothetical protein VW397_00590 [Candidatus Margulisiibacteriota bacterium]
MKRNLILFLLFTSLLHANDWVKGYKNNYYQLFSATQDVCELNSKYIKNWCIPVQSNAMGLYVGFNQVVVYSKQMIQGIDTIRRRIKWSINMENAFKLHINYPVIVIFYQNKRIIGYDYFTGFQLWEKNGENYNNMFETDTDLFLVNQKKIDKLDVISGDVIYPIELTQSPVKLVGNNVYLFYQSKSDLFHYNVAAKRSSLIERGYGMLDQSSTLVWVGNANQSQLRTKSNRIVSENVNHQLFKVHTPTKTVFSYVQDQHLIMLDEKYTRAYQFTQTLNEDRIIYGYKINNKLRVFFNGGSKVWTLKRQKKNEFVRDT